MDREHNTFTRQVMLRERYAELSRPFTRKDATALTDAVRCSFVDDKRAEAAFKGTNIEQCEDRFVEARDCCPLVSR